MLRPYKDNVLSFKASLLELCKSCKEAYTSGIVPYWCAEILPREVFQWLRKGVRLSK